MCDGLNENRTGAGSTGEIVASLVELMVCLLFPLRDIMSRTQLGGWSGSGSGSRGVGVGGG